MKALRASAPGLLLLALTIARPASVGAQAIQRSMYVSVLNEAGAPVPDLGPSDFIIREDNVGREVLRVAPADDPMQVALLIDNSQAATEYVTNYREALTQFVTALTTPTEGSGRNEVAIITIGERPTIATGYTFDRAALVAGVGRLFAQPGSGAYLLDGIVEVSRGLVKRGALRPVIVAISTEGPEYSNQFHDQVLAPLSTAGAAFHAIVLGQPRDLSTNEARERAQVLATGTKSSGGRYDNLMTGMALPRKLQELAGELLHQYRVTYARPQSLIPPEHTTVAVKRAGLTARGTVVKEPREQGKP